MHRKALESPGRPLEGYAMQKTLPKGHASCLSSEFKYTPATHTDLGKTFTRIRRQLKGQLDEDQVKVCPLPARIGALASRLSTRG